MKDGLPRMTLRERFEAFFGSATPGERRAIEILRVHRDALSRTRDAASRMLNVARGSEVECGDRGTILGVPAAEWLAFAEAVLGAEHPCSVEFRERIAAAELVHGLTTRAH